MIAWAGPVCNYVREAGLVHQRIAAIGEDMAQPREAADDLGKHQRRSAVLDVGRVDHGVDQIALCVGEDMALAALDLLACIVTARPAAFRGFVALAVNLPRRWAMPRDGPPRDQSATCMVQ